MVKKYSYVHVPKNKFFFTLVNILLRIKSESLDFLHQIIGLLLCAKHQFSNIFCHCFLLSFMKTRAKQWVQHLLFRFCLKLKTRRNWLISLFGFVACIYWKTRHKMGKNISLYIYLLSGTCIQEICNFWAR